MKVNGKEVKVQKDVSLIQFLNENKYNTSVIAVELNGDIVAKKDYENIKLKDSDFIEIVSFVGGG